MMMYELKFDSKRIKKIGIKCIYVKKRDETLDDLAINDNEMEESKEQKTRKSY